MPTCPAVSKKGYVFQCAKVEILFITKDIYRGEMDTANRLQEIIDNRWLSDIAYDAKQLLNRLNGIEIVKVAHG